MPRVTFELKEVVSNFLKTGSTRKVEVFRAGTYATGAGSSSTALTVAERGIVANGDTIYVGTENGTAAFVTTL